MAESDDSMARLSRLEGDFIQVADGLVLQGERSATVSNRLDALQDEVRTMREALTDRLDRLIALTTRERTLSVAPLAAIEGRLARVEERLGL